MLEVNISTTEKGKGVLASLRIHGEAETMACVCIRTSQQPGRSATAFPKCEFKSRRGHRLTRPTEWPRI